MNANGRYCPFLNRSDPRCSEYFSLNHLDYTLSHCFASYQSCPIYEALLVERKSRSGGGLDAGKGADHAQPGYLQIRLPARYAEPVADTARVPVVSGL